MGNSPSNAASAAAGKEAVGTSAAPPTVDYSAMSDEAILSQPEGQGDQAGAGASGTPPAQAGEGQQGAVVEGTKPVEEAKAGEPTGEAKEGETPDKPLQEVVVPEDFKAVFQQPGVGPKVRDLFFREAAYREAFPTVAEARQVRELFPAGVEDAQKAVQAGEIVSNFDEVFYSTEPEQRQQFWTLLHEQDPQAFAAVMGTLPEVLYDLVPEVHRSFAQRNVVDFLANLRDVAALDKSEAGQNRLAAIEVLARWQFQKTADDLDREAEMRDPRSLDLARREAAIKQNEAKQQAATFRAFYDKTNEIAVGKLMEGIRKRVDGLLNQSAATDGAKKRIVGDIYNSIDKTLQANRELKAQIRRACQSAREGGYTEAEQQKVATILLNRALGLLDPTAKRVVTEWKNDLLGTAAERKEKQAQAETRVEVGGGAGTGTAARPATVDASLKGKVDYRKTTDEDILADKVTLKQ